VRLFFKAFLLSVLVMFLLYSCAQPSGPTHTASVSVKVQVSRPEQFEQTKAYVDELDKVYLQVYDSTNRLMYSASTSEKSNIVFNVELASPGAYTFQVQGKRVDGSIVFYGSKTATLNFGPNQVFIDTVFENGTLRAVVEIDQIVWSRYDVESASLEIVRDVTQDATTMTLTINDATTIHTKTLYPAMYTLTFRISLAARNSNITPPTWSNIDNPVVVSVPIDPGREREVKFRVYFENDIINIVAVMSEISVPYAKPVENLSAIWDAQQEKLSLEWDYDREDAEFYVYKEIVNDGYEYYEFAGKTQEKRYEINNVDINEYYRISGVAVNVFVDGKESGLVVLRKESIVRTDAWQRTFGGRWADEAMSVQETNDGGYIVGGYTWSFGMGNSDVYILKLDSHGNLVWEKTFGGTERDYALSIQQTSDGGYIVAGMTESFGAGYYDVYVLKLDANGNKVWEKVYGGSNNEEARSIRQTSDGGYIVAGYTKSFGAGESDVYILKLDPSGNKVWDATFGEGSWEGAYSVQETNDGGYIVAGWTQSFGVAMVDVYVLKLSSGGELQWYRTFGGDRREVAFSICQSSDGGYVFAGYTESFGARMMDVYIVKLDENGNKVWEKVYGGSNNEEAWSIRQTSDGGYIVAGYTESFGAGGKDVYVLKLDANGNKVWEKTFGGSSDDRGRSIQQTSDNGYILVGRTGSFGAGDVDVYILKLDKYGNSGPHPQ